MTNRMLPKCFIFISILFHTISPLWAQTSSTQNPTAQGHYGKRLEEFKNDSIMAGSIIFLGNSITEGGDWKRLLNNDSVINRGIGGDVTLGVLQRLDEILRHNPSKIFIKIGINDIGTGVDPQQILSNYSQIITQIVRNRPNTKIYVQSILPVNSTIPNFPRPYNQNDEIVLINSQLKNLCRVNNIEYIDIYSEMLDKKGMLKKEYTTDGLHLSAKGYKVWANYLKEKKYL